MSLEEINQSVYTGYIQCMCSFKVRNKSISIEVYTINSMNFPCVKFQGGHSQYYNISKGYIFESKF